MNSPTHCLIEVPYDGLYAHKCHSRMHLIKLFFRSHGVKCHQLFNLWFFFCCFFLIQLFLRFSLVLYVCLVFELTQYFLEVTTIVQVFQVCI
jgi:hypothetical protein